MSCQDDFFLWLSGQESPRVVEIGTRGWDGRPPRHHRDKVLRACPSASWVGVDAEAGDGVDVVADAHELSNHFPPGHFGAAVLAFTLEHFRRPWLAAAELAKVTKPGGRVWVATHQAFPIHGFPSDYFRFSVDALKEVFAPDVGWKVIQAKYSCPAKILPLENVFAHAHDWNFQAEAWLNVECVAERV